jgi:CubicO group peptidase (beta-lactamase class C family)
VGLLISNKTLAEEFSQRHGVELGWKTKLVDVLGPELWKLWDEDFQRGATIEDLLVHRTGLPRHDYSGFQWSGNVREMVSSTWAFPTDHLTLLAFRSRDCATYVPLRRFATRSNTTT